MELDPLSNKTGRGFPNPNPQMIFSLFLLCYPEAATETSVREHKNEFYSLNDQL